MQAANWLEFSDTVSCLPRGGPGDGCIGLGSDESPAVATLLDVSDMMYPSSVVHSLRPCDAFRWRLSINLDIMVTDMLSGAEQGSQDRSGALTHLFAKVDKTPASAGYNDCCESSDRQVRKEMPHRKKLESRVRNCAMRERARLLLT